MGSDLTFYFFAAVAVVASLLVIAQRNPIYSVLLLIASFGALSGLYVLLEAPFVAVIQIIVYAGAIMVLFLFVVMLLNAPHEETEYDERIHRLEAERGEGVPAERVRGAGAPGVNNVRGEGVPAEGVRGAGAPGVNKVPLRFGAFLAAALMVELVWALVKGGGEAGAFPGKAVTSVKDIGQLLFTEYAFAFEVTSILILVAMVGAVVLARRETPPGGRGPRSDN